MHVPLQPDEDIRDLYDQLDSAKAKLTPEVIKSSGIGKQLNLLRKKCSSQALAKRGKQFVLGLVSLAHKPNQMGVSFVVVSCFCFHFGDFLFFVLLLPFNAAKA